VYRSGQGRRNEFKSGGTRAVRIKWWKLFWRVSLNFFWITSTISRFVQRFDGQRQFDQFLFAVLPLAVPPRAQPFVKVGVYVLPSPMESAPLVVGVVFYLP